MASTILFIVMAIIACLLLLTASIAITIGAVNAFNSATYNFTAKTRAAHQYLTIGAALGWSALVTLVVILIVAAVAGDFSVNEVSNAILTTTNPTKADLIAAYKGEKELSAGHTIQIILIIILIIVAIITLVVGILAIIAAVELGGIPKDPAASTAYTAAIIGAVAAVGGIAIMIITIIVYLGIRSARQKELKETEAFVTLTEQKLGVKPTELAGAAVVVPK